MGEAGSNNANFCYLGVLLLSVGEVWWSSAESLIRIFILGVTQGKEDAGSVQDFICLFEDSVSSRFFCIITGM